jgi:tetratricopeptide (TPR) repeat protein
MHVRCKWLRAGLRFAVGGAVLMFAIGAAASPFLPTDDAQVLERLPGGNTPQFRQLRSLRSAAALAPNDIARATILATAYIRASRLEGDPRFIGYAQAALTPWWKDTEAPIAVLMLRATILQSRHEFTAALADLDNLLLRDPANPQALLTRATVLTVRGRYAQARGDCNRLYGIAAEIYPVACIAAIDSVTGDAGGAYERLQRAVQGGARVDSGGRAWAQTLLGEIAHRRGDPVAERHFRAALDIGERDLYSLGAYSDWLLDQGRAADVVTLLQNETRVDTLLLRLALAQRTLKRLEARASIDALRARFEASHARGDTVHQRENARFELFLRDDARSALALGLANWKVQREPADLRVLAQAAAASGDAAAIRVVRQWLTATGCEYPAVASLLHDRGGAK